MTKHRVEKNNIPLKAYMRADSHSQCFVINDNGIEHELVSKEMFWGVSEDDNNRLYLDYKKVSGRQLNVRRGIYATDPSRELNEQECDNWLEKNMLDIQTDNIIVVQGYAGTGKSTLLNYVINNYQETEACYIDICEEWSYEKESYLFFTSALNQFIKYLDKVFSLESKKRNKVWNRFISLLSVDYASVFDGDLNNLAEIFKGLKRTNNWKNLKGRVRLKLDALYSERVEKSNRPNNINWYSRGQTQLIVSLIILIISAMHLEKESNNEKFLLIFDNLDIITNPAIPSENIVSLWGTINNYIKFKSKHHTMSHEQLPNIGILISVRKALYSHITSHLPDLEMNIGYDKEYIQVCDISNLYASQKIIEHRINYWLTNGENLDDSTKDKLIQLSQLASIHSKNSIVYQDNTNIDGLNIHINLDAFFNHNYRAFVNAFSELLEKNDYSDFIKKDLSKTSKSKNWQKISTLIYCLSLLYRNSNVWSSLGFGCEYHDTCDFPTTLNRLLLNCLYYSRLGFYLRTKESVKMDLPDNEFLSLDYLVNKFSKNTFIKVHIENDIELNKKSYLSASNNTNILITERLSEMCARNPSAVTANAVGYNSEDDELWRRPLFFVGGIKLDHTAISKQEISDAFRGALVNNNGKNIKFLITDEGMILIRDIVANFEFYSARYSKKELSKPLHHVVTQTEVNDLITPVFEAIKKCIDKHKIFMDDYTKNYNISINEYLGEQFHARTYPKFEKSEYGKHTLMEGSFRPQLHIVRVIYSHIHYFNYTKNYIFMSSLENKSEICKALTNWINEYLELYKNNFYEWIAKTNYNSDNNVYDRLIPLVKQQIDHPEQNINICLRKKRVPKK